MCAQWTQVEDSAAEEMNLEEVDRTVEASSSSQCTNSYSQMRPYTRDIKEKIFGGNCPTGNNVAGLVLQSKMSSFPGIRQRF